MLRLATAISTWPFYNFRYRKLLDEFAKRLQLHVFAGSTLPGKKDDVLEPIRVLPIKLPRRIRYFVSPLFAEFALNVVDVDVVWLFDTASPIHPLLLRAPIVLDADDPKVVLPKEELSRVPKLSLVNELKILKNKMVRKLVVPTEIIKNRFIKLGVEGEKITVIPNGVDTKLFTPSPLPDENIVLYYGTFQEHRSRLLLEVVKSIVFKRKDVKFLLIGDIPPTIRNMLQHMANGRVEMLGFIEHDLLPKYIQRARVCILPQDRSMGGRFPSKLLDYMASGRPVVATNVDESFPLKESGAGIITDVNPEAMAEAITRVLDDGRLAEELARRGVEYAGRYDWTKMVEEYVKLFHDVYNNQ